MKVQLIKEREITYKDKGYIDDWLDDGDMTAIEEFIDDDNMNIKVMIDLSENKREG